MATAATILTKERISFLSNECSQHQANLIEHERQTIRKEFNREKVNPLIEQINQWEKESIDKIQQTAEECRHKLIDYSYEYLLQIENKFNHLTEQIQTICGENDFRHLEEMSEKLHEELHQATHLSIKEQSTTLIKNICIQTPEERVWKDSGITIAGGNGQGDRLNQLSSPYAICIDTRDETLYIADYGNARIVQWKVNARDGRIVAGGNGKGNDLNQLNAPTDLIIDRENNSLLIADEGNRRVIRWSLQTHSHGQILISNIDCRGLTMDNEGSLYVSDVMNNQVKRWKKGQINGTIVAGGNGQGSQLNQLDHPTFLFVDHDYSLYVSDRDNDRVMKWTKDAKEGIVIAGGNGEGNGTAQFCFTKGILGDHFGQIYVADRGNNRIIRWRQGANEGTIVAGGNGRGEQPNQLHWPMGLAFDAHGNLYVVDYRNNRIQKFLLD